jgi:hypothetical protein
MRSRRRFLPLIFITSLLFVGCSDPDLERVAKSLIAAKDAIGIAQTTVIQANAHGLMSNDSTRAVLELCVRASMAGKQATAVTKRISKLDPASQRQLIQILAPIVASFQSSVDSGLLGIKNDQTRIQVQVVLTAVQTALNTAWIILATREIELEEKKSNERRISCNLHLQLSHC